MILCAIWVLLFAGRFNYYILDQVSFPIPLLRCRNRNVLFYCHYPDKLLSTNRASFLKRIYRYVLDFVEEATTGMARTILVNSKFTQNIFTQSFPLIKKWYPTYEAPEILYPAINEDKYILSKDAGSIEKLLKRNDLYSSEGKSTMILTSLNRYERKKNINLALESFA